MRNSEANNQRTGCLSAVFKWLLGLIGIGRKSATRHTTEPLDQKYREFVDVWVSEQLGRWLHETRAEIDPVVATKALLGEAHRYPDVTIMIHETMIDAKITFSQRSGAQYLEIEAYMAPRQTNGTQPKVLRWRAERAINWQEIPDDVREQLIRQRQPVTLGYAIPQ